MPTIKINGCLDTQILVLKNKETKQASLKIDVSKTLPNLQQAKPLKNVSILSKDSFLYRLASAIYRFVIGILFRPKQEANSGVATSNSRQQPNIVENKENEGPPPVQGVESENEGPPLVMPVKTEDDDTEGAQFYDCESGEEEMNIPAKVEEAPIEKKKEVISDKDVRILLDLMGGSVQTFLYKILHNLFSSIKVDEQAKTITFNFTKKAKIKITNSVNGWEDFQGSIINIDNTKIVAKYDLDKHSITFLDSSLKVSKDNWISPALVKITRKDDGVTLTGKAGFFSKSFDFSAEDLISIFYRTEVVE